MLKIQRASAGSGKTYTLTENFIINLIAYPATSGKWFLRNELQMEEALQHILAITFTNKATNEMKQRIVNSFFKLSLYDKSKSPASFPYLLKLHKLTGASFEEISENCKLALRIILNNYSLFKISTIDSFFQEILRTFAYEANISDTYQLEIDSSFVTDSALDNAIQKIDTHPSEMGNSAFWLKTIMQLEAQVSQKWNPFNKKATSGSVYSRIRKALSQLENEEFKGVKELLDLHFGVDENKPKLLEFYKTLKRKAEEERDRNLKEIRRSLNNIEQLMLKNHYNPDNLNSHFIKHISLIRELKPEDKISFKFDSILKEKSVFKKKFREADNPLDIEALIFYDLLDQWNNPALDSYYKNWKIYGELIPYLGLIVEVREFLSRILQSNNLIQLHDTSYLLKKIIGQDDAPFIFERLGNKINHYLIDEFQDTSKMQWDVIYPLLKEGMSKEFDSLIIGDPKQNIYRFRNANHTIITQVVPEAFPDHIAAGFSKEDNTNWRSHTNIIKFNNYFFKNLASLITSLSEKNGIPTDFNKLYSNVVQYPHNQKGKGYVEIRFFEKPIIDEGSDEGGTRKDELRKDWFEKEALRNIAPLVKSLISRGYRQKDIAILVSTNESGKEVVESLITYNESLDEKDEKINFISEESLLISSSQAVEIILSVLEKIVSPSDPAATKEKDENASGRPPKFYWNKIKTDYALFSLNHADLSQSEKILLFLNENKIQDYINNLLVSVPVPSLTSLIEVITNTFLSERLLTSDSLYISSFQDLVNEYSANHSNDPASFLEWWDSKGSKSSVSVPEDSDAVQIMTIHKSKGLEFKCVIIPFATDSFYPSTKKQEWRWVIPLKLEELEYPPVLPIKTSAELLGSKHQMIYKEYFDQVLTDKINSYYVAFTRAKNELYVFTKVVEKKSNSFNDYIRTVLTTSINADEFFSYEESNSVMQLSNLVVNDSENLYTYGKPFSTKEILDEYRDDLKLDDKEIHVFKRYSVSNHRPALRSVASRVLPSGENMI